MDTPGWYLCLGYRNGWLNVLRRQNLDFVGLKVTHMKTVGPVRYATPEGIAGFMEVARKLALRGRQPTRRLRSIRQQGSLLFRASWHDISRRGRYPKIRWKTLSSSIQSLPGREPGFSQPARQGLRCSNR
jgi:hypothetical protein